MLDTPCSEVVWRVLATHCIRQFPLHFPLPCVAVCHHIATALYHHTRQETLQAPFRSPTNSAASAALHPPPHNSPRHHIPAACAIGLHKLSSCSEILFIRARWRRQFLLRSAISRPIYNISRTIQTVSPLLQSRSLWPDIPLKNFISIFSIVLLSLLLGTKLLPLYNSTEDHIT